MVTYLLLLFYFFSYYVFYCIASNIKIIQESALASSDYFTLYERLPKIKLKESTLKLFKDQILGKLEFKNVSFIFPSDKNKRKILDNINMSFKQGKTML